MILKKTMQNFTFTKKPFFIAELSANHAGSLTRAKELILTSKNMVQMQSKFKVILQIQLH